MVQRDSSWVLDEIEALLQSKVECLRQIAGGNSTVFVLKCNHEMLVAKKYLGSPERKNDSLQREVRALNFLFAKNISCVPKLLQVSEENNLLFMEYIPGHTPEPNKDTLLAMISFVKMLKYLYTEDNSFPHAVGSITMASDLLPQIEGRIKNLEMVMSRNNLVQEAKELLSTFSSCDYISIYPSETYSVSDLGIHNMLKQKNSYTFLDLEFFGIDSPIKLISDFLLHPRNTFSKPLRLVFYKEIKKLFNLDDSVVSEFLTINTLNWALIILRRVEIMKKTIDSSSVSEIMRLAATYLEKSRLSGDQILTEALYCES